MSGKNLVFKPRKLLTRPFPLTAIFLRGMKAGLSGRSHLDDIVFSRSEFEFPNPKFREVYFAGYHTGNIERWSKQIPEK